MLAEYREMLARWKTLPSSRELTLDEILFVLGE